MLRFIALLLLCCSLTPVTASYHETATSASVSAVKAPKSYVANCTGSEDGQPVKRVTNPEYWSTYLGGIINKDSLKEFFRITKNTYSASCDSWFREYVGSQFHKSLVVAYDKNITGISSYWGFTDSSNSRREAERLGIKACNSSTKKIKSHTCAILFSNNDIKNENYLKLAKSTIPTNASKSD